MRQQMPKADLSKDTLTEAEQAIVAVFVKKDGAINATRPTLPKQVKIQDPNSPYGYHYDYADEAGALRGKAAYVWRWVVLQVSPRSEHHCMPSTDFCYLPHCDYEARKVLEAELQVIARKVVDAVKVSEWHGVRRWGNAFGYTGQPQATSAGQIVYR